MSNAITGLALYAPYGSISGLCAACGGKFYLYDSNGTITPYTGATIDPTAHLTMVQAMDEMYCTDGINPLFVFTTDTDVSTVIVTGTASTTPGKTTVVGSNDPGSRTQFISQLAVGEQITINGETHTIASITDNFTLDTTVAWVGINVKQPYTVKQLSLYVPEVYAADGVTLLANISDMVWFLDRMWYAVGDLIYFSDVGNPLSITSAPIRTRSGAGDKIIRLMVYRDSYLLAWKSNTYGLGSLQALDVSSNDPAQFSSETVPWFDNQSIISPRCMIQTGLTQSADIIFNSREGLRSLTYTSLDKLTSPSLPLTMNLPDTTKTFRQSAMASAFCCLFDDELLFFVPTGSATTPNTCLGYSLKIPRESLQQGWVVYDMMPATCACVAALDGGALKLYLGTADGTIQEAFADTGTHLYTEISKRITYDKPNQDKTPMKYILEQDVEAVGTSTVSILFDDNTEQVVGEQIWGHRGVTFPVHFPCVFPPAGITTNFTDLHFDISGNPLPRSKDFRSKIVSADSPSILGFSLQSTLEEYRYEGLNDDTGTNAPNVAAESEITANEFNG